MKYTLIAKKDQMYATEENQIKSNSNCPASEKTGGEHPCNGGEGKSLDNETIQYEAYKKEIGYHVPIEYFREEMKTREASAVAKSGDKLNGYNYRKALDILVEAGIPIDAIDIRNNGAIIVSTNSSWIKGKNVATQRVSEYLTNIPTQKEAKAIPKKLKTQLKQAATAQKNRVAAQDYAYGP